MENKTKITLEDLYKALKFHDAEILKHFNDDELNDEQYLFYAINYDIISNAWITGEGSGLKLEQSKVFMDKFNKVVGKTKK